MDENIKEGVFRVIRFVASPLRFFAAAILGALALILGLAWKSSLPPENTLALIIAILVAVAAVFVLVTYLIICHPKKLVFDQEAHLTYLREHLGDSELPTTYLQGALPQQEPAKQLHGEVTQ